MQPYYIHGFPGELWWLGLVVLTVFAVAQSLPWLLATPPRRRVAFGFVALMGGCALPAFAYAYYYPGAGWWCEWFVFVC